MTSIETVAARIARLGLEGLSDRRTETLATAHEAGVTDEGFVAIARTKRVSQKPTIILPAGRYEGLSRGRGWARQGRGDSATWGEREERGYRVGPGRWTVGSSDGFDRKSSDIWTVTHVTVGDRIWTIAS